MYRLVFSCIFFAGPLIAGIDINQVKRFTIADGLSQNYVSSIIQDQVGYLWIGTKDGLNRYDGYNFTVYNHIPGDTTSLSNDDISLIKEGSGGVLWIGTNGGGLNRFDPRTGHLRTFRLRDAQSPEIGSHYISAISITNDFLLIGTRNGLIYRIENTGLREPKMVTTLARDDHSGLNSLTGILSESDRSLLVVSGNGGLQRYVPTTKTWSTLIRPDSIPGEQRLNPINAVIQKENILWIGRHTGLDKYNLQTGARESFTFRDYNNAYIKILAVAEDRSGHLWLVSHHHLIKFDPARGSYEIFLASESDWFTGAICIDRSGIVWLGTAGEGLFKVLPNLSKFNATPGNYLEYLYPDLIDTLKQIAGLNLEINRARDFLSVITDRDNNYWVASQYHGLFEISNDLQNIRQYPNSDLDFRGRMKNLYAVFEDRNGEIWTTCAGGICRLNRKQSLFEYHRLYPGLDSSRTAINISGYYDITALYQDRSGIFWVGTPMLGLIRYDPEKKQIRYFQSAENEPNNISSNFVLSIAEDPYRPDQILWIGTDGGGLNRYDKITDTFTTFSTVDGLPNNTVYGILPDSDYNLWLSTNQGLSRFDPVNKRFKNFTVSDGLQSNEFNRREYVKTADGELIFGGIHGFNHFYPRSIQG
jgi:ligand-binding sensor domain-containing protein